MEKGRSVRRKECREKCVKRCGKGGKVCYKEEKSVCVCVGGGAVSVWQT